MIRFRLSTLFAFVLFAAIVFWLCQLAQPATTKCSHFSSDVVGDNVASISADNTELLPVCCLAEPVKLIYVRDRRTDPLASLDDDETYVRPAWGSLAVVVGAIVYVWLDSFG